jgi:hypothetical protein
MNNEATRIPVFMQQMAATITKTAGILDQDQMEAFLQRECTWPVPGDQDLSPRHLGCG